MNLKQNSPVEIRPARERDVGLATRLIYLSMGELADYLFGGVHRTVEDILSKLYLSQKTRFSWHRANIAEWGGEPAGMLISFPGWEFRRRELAIGLEMLMLCSPVELFRLAGRALSIANGIETRNDEYYLANLAVLPEFQGRGIGTHLIGHAEVEARKLGIGKCSLIVDTENPSMFRLYERFGYRVVLTKTYSGPAQDANAGYHRLVKELA